MVRGISIVVPTSNPVRKPSTMCCHLSIQRGEVRGGINIICPLSDASIILKSKPFAVGDGEALHHSMVLGKAVGMVLSMVLESLHLHDTGSVHPLHHANQVLFGTVNLDR